MELEDAWADDLIELAKKVIKQEEKYSRTRQAILGYIDADNDIYAEKRKNFVVITGSNQSDNKEIDLMQNVRLRKDGRWEYRKIIDGKRISIIKPNKNKLLEAVKVAKKQGFQNLLPKPSPKHNFKNFALYWFETFKQPNIKKGSADVYKNIIENHFSKLNDMDIDKIELGDLQKVLNEEKGRMRELTYLTIKQIFKQAYFEDLIKKDISAFLKKGTIQRSVRHNLTIKEQETLWKSLKNNRLSLLIRFYLLTGCRREEANITKENLFQDGNNFYVFIDGTKTEKSKRYVKISKTLYDALINMPEHQIFYKDYKSIEKRFRIFVKSLNLKITIHQLRHTFSTNLYILGVPDKKRQSYLGHASIVMTNDVYTHEDPTLTKQKIKNLYGPWLPRF